MSQFFDNGISVVICCYNSEWIIERTLNALKSQIVRSNVPWEIILVDNNCTDNTVYIAQTTMLGSDIPFKVVVEKCSGLANARRTGVKIVRYRIIIFCDDDNLLCSNYLQTMYDIMNSNNHIGAAGGKGIPEFEREPDRAVLENLHDYAVGSQLGHGDYLFGAGLTVLTEVVEDVYSSQRCHLVGRKGDKLLSGDDTELVLSVVLRGYNIYPTDDVYYTHVLKSNRLTKEYLYNLQQGLIIPIPVFDVMRAVIYNKRFGSFLRDYLRCYKNYIKYSLVRWKPWSGLERREACKRLKMVNYWGIIYLYKIYRQWNRIKKMRLLTN